MPIVSRELAVRSASVSLPDQPTYERKFVVSADPGTDAKTVVSATGVAAWASHPEYGFAKAKTFSVAPYGGSRRHWEVTVGYEVPQQDDLAETPLARADVWSFSVGGAQSPALTCYMGTGNGGIAPLTNTAGDYFEGLTGLEGEVKASISGNRATFPMSTAIAYTNSVNAGEFLGGAPHTWLCTGISGQQAVEVVNDAEVRFWQISVELVYRASSHNLLLPNVGYNFVKNGKKARCWVYGTDENGNMTTARVPAVNPQKLTMAGDIDPTIPNTENKGPIILTRRIYPERDFSAFGSP